MAWWYDPQPMSLLDLSILAENVLSLNRMLHDAIANDDAYSFADRAQELIQLSDYVGVWPLICEIPGGPTVFAELAAVSPAPTEWQGTHGSSVHDLMFTVAYDHSMATLSAVIDEIIACDDPEISESPPESELDARAEFFQRGGRSVQESEMVKFFPLIKEKLARLPKFSKEEEKAYSAQLVQESSRVSVQRYRLRSPAVQEPAHDEIQSSEGRAHAGTAQPSSPPPRGTPHVSVERGRGKITVDGEEYDANPEWCSIVQALIDAEGRYVTGPEMQKLPGCKGRKIWKVIQNIEQVIPTIKPYLRHEGNKGYRLLSG